MRIFYGFDSRLRGRFRRSALGAVSAAALAFCVTAPPASALPIKEELRALDPAGHCAQRQCEPPTEGREPTALLAAPPRPARLRFHLRRRGRKVVVRVRVLRGEGHVLVRVRRADGRLARRTGVSRRGSLWRYAFRLQTRGRWRANISFRAAPGWTGMFVRLRPFSVSE